MPEVEYTTVVNASVDEVWSFVEDMGKWGPFLTGYQRHEVIDDTDSVWVLKGDVGLLARTVQLRVHITEWVEKEKAAFTLKGLTEPLTGGGTFLLAPYQVGESAPVAPEPEKVGWFHRVVEFVVRIFVRRMQGGEVQRSAPEETNLTGPGSKLTFRLDMSAGGVSGPMVNAMMAPLLRPAAEDLANRIAHAVEEG